MRSVLSGSIHFSETGGTLSITDDILVPNSVSVTMSTCPQNKFDVGTFNAAMLKMGVIDDEANSREYAGAVIDNLQITVTPDEGEPTTYKLGKYTVDGSTVKRNGNKVTFTAQDESLKFNIEIESSAKTATYTALTALQAACTAADVYLATNALSGFVNTSVEFTLENKQIQTWRDAVMWVCTLICGNAVLDRLGALVIKPAKYAASADHTVEASQRADISFSDKRLFVKYLTAYSDGNVKTYMTQYEPTQEEHRQHAELTLPYNPLLAGKSESDCDAINEAILNNLSGSGIMFLQRQITAKLFDAPQIGLGQHILFKGGKIDPHDRTGIRGFTTHIVWRYHGFTTVTCTAPDAVYEAEGGAS